MEQIRYGYLTISAAKGLDKDEEDKKGNYIRRERYAGSTSRSFYVGEGIHQEDVKASFDNGELKITLPTEVKKEEEAKQTIRID